MLTKKSSIIENLKKQRATRLNRSFTSSENNEKRVQKKAAKVIHMKEQGSLGEGKFLSELALSNAYYSGKETYTQCRTYKQRKSSKRSTALWHRVLTFQERSLASPEEFIQAQVDYFHNVFGRYPELKDLQTDAAVMRADLFLESKKSTRKIVANAVKFSSKEADLFKLCEKQMMEICSAQDMTREEVYRNLVLTGLVSFPKNYLNADPAWKIVHASESA